MPDNTFPQIDWSNALTEHDAWLRTAVLARLGERQAVEDVMQEVALAAVAQQAPLADPGRVGAWLYRLTVRQVLLYRRRCGRQRRLLGQFAGQRESHQRVSSESDPLHWLLRDERHELVRRGLSRLHSRDSEILLLKYAHEWSYRQLAERLGISESAVEARLFRARQRLREIMLVAEENEAPNE